MIVTASGAPYRAAYVPPTPSTEMETSVRAMLKNMDALLDIRWMPLVFYNERHKAWEGRYALLVEWPSIDGRWAMVQSGEISPADATDIVGWLCEDMQDSQSVPTTSDGVETRVIDLLGKIDNVRYPWKGRMLATLEKNRLRHKAIKDESLDLTHDEAEYEYRRARGVPQSVGANFSKEGKLLV